MKKQFSLLVGLLISMTVTSALDAALIDFTGGTITRFSAPLTATPDNTTSYNDVDFYVQDGVKFDFIGPAGDPFSYHVGDYYSVGNDVIHGHWAAGPFGDMDSIRVEKTDGTAFDLNYFKITSNTASGGGPASGSEEVYINALADGVAVSATMLLPPDDWGFAGPNSEIYLGSDFDGIKAFTFTFGSGAVGFGLDDFFIDEEPPPAVPEPSSIVLFGFGLAGLGLGFRKRTAKAKS